MGYGGSRGAEKRRPSVGRAGVICRVALNKIKESLFSAISAAIVCLSCLSAFVFSHDALAGTLVVVPPGLEQVEGNSIRGKSPHPDPDDTVIFQHVYPASEFLGVAAGQHEIVAMRLRLTRM